MAVPRHKTSKSKKGQRRSHHAMVAPQRSVCPRCNSEKLPHRVCGNCGFYKGERKLEVEGI
ncbi:MAG: 50S ribosomal protein L32 [Planctomycetes bacterium]|nr:50S ribosomal protein L32 [Planctomycetota bacterium]